MLEDGRTFFYLELNCFFPLESEPAFDTEFYGDQEVKLEADASPLVVFNLCRDPTCAQFEKFSTKVKSLDAEESFLCSDCDNLDADRQAKETRKCSVNKQYTQQKGVQNDAFFIEAWIDYFTPSAKAMIAFNEPIILPDNLNANSSVSDFFNVWLEDTNTQEKIDGILDGYKFENIYSQYWYFNYTFFNDTYFKERNCSIVMEFLHPDYSSFHDQRAYPLEETVLKHEIPA